MVEECTPHDLTIEASIDNVPAWIKRRLTEYRIELAATFDIDIYSTVVGLPGLDRSAIEEIIDRDWAWISADKNVLQESHLAADRYRAETEHASE